MGIPLKTRHREVAPNQYEFAPLYGINSAQIDQNLIVREAVEDMDIAAIRESMNIRDKQKMLIAFAWITGKELSLLRRFPEFLCGDVTERTNKEKRGLFLVTG